MLPICRLLARRKIRPQPAKPISIMVQVEASGTVARTEESKVTAPPDGPEIVSNSVSEKGPSIGSETVTGGTKNPNAIELNGSKKFCEAKSVASPNGTFKGS